MLIPEGCHRCRTLRTRCSLALPITSTSAPEGYTNRDQSTTSVSPEQDQGHGRGLEEKGILRRLDERTKRIEGLLHRETGARQPPVIRKDEGLRVERLQPIMGSVGAAVHLASGHRPASDKAQRSGLVSSLNQRRSPYSIYYDQLVRARARTFTMRGKRRG
ncbi:hypothetical protein AYX13_06954 [Cryptococcus neoformans]|nr:hypothetical protein AYX13_06954 [Cryptococcus neoformans var. grubii]